MWRIRHAWRLHTSNRRARGRHTHGRRTRRRHGSSHRAHWTMSPMSRRRAHWPRVHLADDPRGPSIRCTSTTSTKLACSSPTTKLSRTLPVICTFSNDAVHKVRTDIAQLQHVPKTVGPLLGGSRIFVNGEINCVRFWKTAASLTVRCLKWWCVQGFAESPRTKHQEFPKAWAVSEGAGSACCPAWPSGAHHASGGAGPPRRQVSNVGCGGGGAPKPSARNESTRLQSTSANFRGSSRQDSGSAPALQARARSAAARRASAAAAVLSLTK